MLSKIESILFVASKPLTSLQIAKVLKVEEVQVEENLEELKKKYNDKNSGIIIITEDGKYQMSSNPNNIDVVENFVKDEVSGELTRAQLETLTIIAYRSPVSRPELEKIRGVNCAVILRNLLMRGLINQKDDEDKALPVYSLSLEAMRHLGISSVKDLPDYENLSQHEYIDNLLEDKDL